MSGAPQPDDLEVEQTEGFKLGEKKTIAEYQNLGMLLLVAQQSIMPQPSISANGTRLLA